jgi:D-glycero-alpha-D-manno-heptose-7-phosphate kinase
MIITRSPLRITLGGGGTDLPSYYRHHGGFLVAAAIDRYVFVTVTRPFVPGIYLKYSKLEHVETADEVQHPIIREAIKMLNFRTPQIEITTLADVPAGTGLGSSGSFTTALLKGLYAHRRRALEVSELASRACEIEIDRLGDPTGKQDQYIAAYGGLTCFAFDPDEGVRVEPLRLPMSALFDLEDHLLLFFTGFERKAGVILGDQARRTAEGDAAMLQNLHTVKALGLESRKRLEAGNLPGFAELMDEQWRQKRQRSTGMTNPQIDEWYELGMKNGALGGKLVGAGAGGFLMFYAEDRARLRNVMTKAGLEELRFKFDFEGTKVLVG